VELKVPLPVFHALLPTSTPFTSEITSVVTSEESSVYTTEATCEVSSETSIVAFWAVIDDLRATTKGYSTKKRIYTEFPHHSNYLCVYLGGYLGVCLGVCLGDDLRGKQNGR
jgi:hypothetical protein